MALRPALLLLSLIIAMVVDASAGGYVGSDALAHAPRLFSDGASASRTCDALVGDCIGEEEEMDMESDITRRTLAGVTGRKRFISYGALSKNRVPCNRRGQSYYNCRKFKRVNPYRRGCTVITKCARYLH